IACETSVSAAVAPPDFAISRMVCAIRSSAAVETGNCPAADVSAPLDFGARRVMLNDEVIDSLCERMSRRACAPSPCRKQCGAPMGMIAKPLDQPRFDDIL